MLSSLKSWLARIGPWPRRALALVCLLLAAGSFLAGSPPRDPAAATRQVVVATRAFPIGHRLTAPDLVRRAWPDDLVPEDALTRPDALLGRVLASPVARGEPVTNRRVVGRDLTSGLGPDEVAAVVGVSDAASASLIGAGDRVDVLASPATAEPTAVQASAPPVSGGTPLAGTPPAVGPIPTVLVEGARVLAVLPGSGDFQTAPEVVIATSREAAARVVRARGLEMLTILSRSP